MLTVYIKEAAFHERVILTESTLTLSKGVLSILSGDSGTGKSTLIDALTLRNTFAERYVVDDQAIHEMSYEDKKKYIYEHMGVVYQKPQLLEDLTIRSQMAMIQELRGLKSDPKQWIAILELEELLDKYPAKLSGGEQVRAAILLVLMKEPDILILDEPSAALDAYHSANVIKAVKRYCEIGHTVLISSHDEEIIEQGDQIYRIENQHLRLIKNSTGHKAIDILNHKRVIEKNMDFLHEYFRMMKKHRKLYQKMLRYLTIFAVAFVSFGAVFNNLTFANTNSVYYTQLSKTLVVFKGKDKSQNMYPFNANTQPLSAADRKVLDTLSTPLLPILVRERFDIPLYQNTLAYSIGDEEYWDKEKLSSQSVIRIKKDGKEIARLQEEEEKSVLMSTYVRSSDPENDEDYQEEIKKSVRTQFHYDGIYLSDAVAKKLGLQDAEYQDATIDLDALIPVYSTKGKKDTQGNASNYPTCVMVTIPDVPIAGILNYSDFLVRNSSEETPQSENVVYIEYSFLEPYLKEYRPLRSRTLYHTSDGQVFVDELPEDKKDAVDAIEEDSPWLPDVYEVVVPQYNNIASITSKLSNAQLNVNANGSSYPATSKMTKDLKAALRFASIALAIIVFFAYIAMKFNDLEHEHRINQYFSDLGLTNKEIKKIKMRMFIRDGGLITWYSILLEGVLIYGSDLIGFGMSGYDLILVFTTLLMAMFVEFAIPYALERGNQIDQVK